MPHISPAKDFCAGAFGGVCLVAAGHPFDTVKVRLQTMSGPTPQYSGALDCVMKTVKNEGFFGLYKGMGAPLLGVAPMYAICFAGYAFGKKIQQRTPDAELNLFQIFNAGLISGVGTTIIMVPGERIKCLLQIQTTAAVKKYNGPFDCAAKLYREGGIRSIYRGTLFTMMRDVPGTGIYFAIYEGMKRWLATGDSQQLSPWRVMVAGGMSGVGMWMCMIPVDTLKSRLQTASEGTSTNLRDVYRQLVREKGILGLYRGTVPVLLRAFPANAACFFGYEMAMKLLNYIF